VSFLKFLSVSRSTEFSLRHVSKALKVLMKNVQAQDDVEVPEDELEEMVGLVRRFSFPALIIFLHISLQKQRSNRTKNTSRTPRLLKHQRARENLKPKNPTRNPTTR